MLFLRQRDLFPGTTRIHDQQQHLNHLAESFNAKEGGDNTNRAPQKQIDRAVCVVTALFRVKTLRQMIKVLLLVVYPRRAWEKIALAQKSMGFVFFAFLLPLLTISLAAELAGVVHWGKRLGPMRVLTQFPPQTVWRYGRRPIPGQPHHGFVGAMLIGRSRSRFIIATPTRNALLSRRTA